MSGQKIRLIPKSALSLLGLWKFLKSNKNILPSSQRITISDISQAVKRCVAREVKKWFLQIFLSCCIVFAIHFTIWKPHSIFIVTRITKRSSSLLCLHVINAIDFSSYTRVVKKCTRPLAVSVEIHYNELYITKLCKAILCPAEGYIFNGHSADLRVR